MARKPTTPILCSICGKKAKSRHLCNTHYVQAQRAGKLTDFAKVSMEESIESRIDKTGDCWIWLGQRDENGYGNVYFYPDGKQKTTKAHRYIYEMYVGQIPPGMLLMHSCDNPPCVNPAHLTPGTDADNMRDSYQKGRNSRGETHGMSKFTNEQIRAIRIDPRFQRIIAEEYGTTQSMVSQIKNRVRWKHIP